MNKQATILLEVSVRHVKRLKLAVRMNGRQAFDTWVKKQTYQSPQKTTINTYRIFLILSDKLKV
jgi:hypothetical protein